MKILAIETSCDETAIAILECSSDPSKGEQDASFIVLGNALLSQIEIHKKYGGVFPALAKREHAKNLVPILEAALEEAELLHEDRQVIPEETRAKISEILAREPGLDLREIESGRRLLVRFAQLGLGERGELHALRLRGVADVLQDVERDGRPFDVKIAGGDEALRALRELGKAVIIFLLPRAPLALVDGRPRH